MRSLQESRVGGRGSTFGRFSFPLSAFDFSLGLRSQVSGFSLVEVIIAMGIAAFCLIAMLGLIPMGLKQVKISSEQTAATAILASVVDDIRNTPPGTTATNSLTYEISIPAQGSSNIPSVLYLKEDGTKNPNNEYPARYALTASLVSSNNVSALTSGSLVIWWPAKAPRAKALGSVEAVVSFNRN